MALATPPVVTSEAPADAPATRLRASDVILLAYVAIVAVVALARSATFPGCRWLVLSNLLIGVLVALVTRPGLGRFGRAVREVYPILLLPGLYAQLDVLSGGGAMPVYDEVIRRIEVAVFGGEPSRTWWQTSPSAFWSTLLHAAYLVYYPIVLAPAIVFALRGDPGAIRRYVTAVLATFTVCYLIFLFVPVAGPYYQYPRPTGPFVDNWAARLVYQVLESGSSYGAAFPSSHVAATMAAVISAWRGWRAFGAVLLVPALLLTVGVVYCQMHYAIDAVVGLALGILIPVVADRAERAFARRAAA